VRRNRVQERGEIIYSFLRDRLNEPFTIKELMSALSLHDGSTTRAAIRRARDLAADDGLCFPVACWDNGLSYCVTDVPATVIDPSIHLGKIALGVGVRKDVHDDFIRSRMAKLTPVDRAMFHSLEKFEAAQREQRAAYADVLKAITEIRRSQRGDTA